MELQSGSVSEIAPSALAERLARKETLAVLDVREASEVAAGVIPEALWIPMGEISSRLEEIPRDREVVVVCRSGRRSETVCRQLTKLGFKTQNMVGGMLAWTGATSPPPRR